MQLAEDSSNSILIVEDEGLIAVDLQRKLEALGYVVPAIASSGREALRCARSMPFDLALMDIRLKGGMDGIATAQALKSEFGKYVVYVTAHADQATLNRAKVTEPLGYISKPIRDADLRSVVEISLYKINMERRLRTSQACLSATLRSVGASSVAEGLAGWSGADAHESLLTGVPGSSEGSAFHPKTFLSRVGEGRSSASYSRNQMVFSQGDPADAVFYVESGKVKLSVVSAEGKEAVVGMIGSAEFFGEGCLSTQTKRMATATAFVDSRIVRLDRVAVLRVLRSQPKFASMFISYLLARNIRIEEDLVDQLFNSSEKRLARVLLLLANFGKDGKPEAVIPKVSQEVLAEMVGTTRSRVSFFMNKFRKLGFIEYHDRLEVHSSLLSVLLHD